MSALDEVDYRPDVIERQLEHKEPNKVRAAYNRTEYLPQRRKMMQQWAGMVDACANGADVVSIKPRASRGIHEKSNRRTSYAAPSPTGRKPKPYQPARHPIGR